MVAFVVAAMLFVGVLAAGTLLFFHQHTRVQATSLELSRRLGPVEVDVPVVWTREVDATGRCLGPLGHHLHTMLLRAGSDHTVAEVVVLSVTLAVAGVAGMGLAVGMPQALLGALLALVPYGLLVRMGRLRSQRITAQLPDALDLMSRTLRSGHAFSDALRLVAEEMSGPLGDELRPAAEQHRLGIELRACLDGLVARVPDNFELRMFASSVLLHRDTGGNLIEILDHLADTVRERVVFEQKVLALTAEVRTSARILEFLPVGAAVLLSVVVPGYLLPMLQPGMGRNMLMFAVLSMVAGMLVMRRIADVEA